MNPETCRCGPSSSHSTVLDMPWGRTYTIRYCNRCLTAKDDAELRRLDTDEVAHRRSRMHALAGGTSESG